MFKSNLLAMSNLNERIRKIVCYVVVVIIIINNVLFLCWILFCITIDDMHEY